LGYFLDWCECSGIKHLDQLTDGDDLLPYVSFLRQRQTTRDALFEPHYVYNIFRTCTTFLRSNAILFAGEILGQLDYEEKEVKPYKPEELKAPFQAADNEEKLWMSHFLNTGSLGLRVRERVGRINRIAEGRTAESQVSQ
jgi:hypothetical protein